MENQFATTLGISKRHKLCVGKTTDKPERSSCHNCTIVQKAHYPPAKKSRFTRYFGYSTAAAIPRSQSHFGVVEEGSEFAISDLRFFVPVNFTLSFIRVFSPLPQLIRIIMTFDKTKRNTMRMAMTIYLKCNTRMIILTPGLNCF